MFGLFSGGYASFTEVNSFLEGPKNERKHLNFPCASWYRVLPPLSQRTPWKSKLKTVKAEWFSGMVDGQPLRKNNGPSWKKTHSRNSRQKDLQGFSSEAKLALVVLSFF